MSLKFLVFLYGKKAMRTVRSIFNALKKGLQVTERPKPKGILNTDIDLIVAAAAAGNVREVARLFDKYNDDPSIYPLTTGVDSSRTLLHRAAVNGFADLMGLLLKRGADIEARDRWGGSPLYLAAAGGQAKAVEFLLAQGADIHARADAGLPVLYAALPHPALIGQLIDRGANVDAADDGGWTPLAWACVRKDIPDPKATMEMLLGRGARLDVVARDGKTLLTIAREYGSEDIAARIEREAAEREANLFRLREDIIVRPLRLKTGGPGA